MFTKKKMLVLLPLGVSLVIGIITFTAHNQKKVKDEIVATNTLFPGHYGGMELALEKAPEIYWNYSSKDVVGEPFHQSTPSEIALTICVIFFFLSIAWTLAYYRPIKK